ncbi:MAG: hypothetical protein IPK93_05045 [Solirubrobacterales bacterium]|nr:hypothetical protein [Solirubrobacterales bacterium]
MPDESKYLLLNIDEVTDMAPQFELGEVHEARFATKPLGLTQTGFSHFLVKPNVRQPFGHHHKEGEEVHMVLDGTGRGKLEDDIVELKKGDVLKVAPEVVRAFEAGPDGLEFIVFSQHFDDDMEMVPDWWTD